MHATASEWRRRWHDGVPKRRGARLESFQEDAARCGGRMVLAAGVAVSPASATVPTKGSIPRKRTSRIWRGAASTSASASATRRLDLVRERRQLGARGLERRSCQRFGAGAAGDVRPASSLQRLRLHGLRVAEGRRRLHQARRHAVEAGRELYEKQFMVALDGAQHADRHRRRRSVNAGDFCNVREDTSGSSAASIRTGSAIRRRIRAPHHGDVKGNHPADRQLRRVGPR